MSALTSPRKRIIVATASWSIPPEARDLFPLAGTHLERYSQKLNGVEINSSFYRHHQAKTYARWRSCTPETFRFSVKLAKLFTHEQKLCCAGAELGAALTDILFLGEKLSVLLVQLPPSLALNIEVAADFFSRVRSHYTGPIALEPRHISWNSESARNLYAQWNLTRVLTDPEPIPNLVTPSSLVYYRLHGSPQIYKSDYTSQRLEDYSQQLKNRALTSEHIWCVFDNTTFGHATPNALWVHKNINAPLDLHTAMSSYA